MRRKAEGRGFCQYIAYTYTVLLHVQVHVGTFEQI